MAAAQKFGVFGASMALFAAEQQRQRLSMFSGSRSSDMEDIPSEPRRAICIMDSQPN